MPTLWQVEPQDGQLQGVSQVEMFKLQGKRTHRQVYVLDINAQRSTKSNKTIKQKRMSTHHQSESILSKILRKICQHQDCMSRFNVTVISTSATLYLIVEQLDHSSVANLLKRQKLKIFAKGRENIFCCQWFNYGLRWLYTIQNQTRRQNDRS